MGAEPYVFREFQIPAYMMEPLLAYVREHRPIGGFLAAVFSNDFEQVCARADTANLANLPAYAAYLFNDAPAGCWGSPEKVRAWLERGRPAEEESA